MKLSDYKHDLDFIKSKIDALEDIKTILIHTFYQRANLCIYHMYDNQAFETNCNHPEVNREIVQLRDCSKCAYFTLVTKGREK